MVQSNKSPQTNPSREQWKQTLYYIYSTICTSLRVVSGYHQTFRNQHTPVYPDMCKEKIWNYIISNSIPCFLLLHDVILITLLYILILYMFSLNVTQIIHETQIGTKRNHLPKRTPQPIGFLPDAFFEANANEWRTWDHRTSDAFGITTYRMYKNPSKTKQ